MQNLVKVWFFLVEFVKTYVCLCAFIVLNESLKTNNDILWWFLILWWHNLQTIEGLFLQGLTMIGMSNLNKFVSTLTHILAKQWGNTMFGDNVVDMSARGNNTGTYLKKRKMFNKSFESEKNYAESYLVLVQAQFCFLPCWWPKAWQ